MADKIIAGCFAVLTLVITWALLFAAPKNSTCDLCTINNTSYAAPTPTPKLDYSKCQDGMIKHIFDDWERCFCRGMSGITIDCNDKYIPLCKTLDFRGEGYKKIMPSIKNETICKNMVERYLDKNDFTSAPR